MTDGQQPILGNKMQAPDERERYLAALVEIQTLLLSEPYGEANLKSILQILGRAAGASRVYIHANSRRDDGQWFSSRLAQWVAPGDPSSTSQPDRPELSYTADFPHWFSVLSRGMYVNEVAADFPAPESEFLRLNHILAVLVLPIFVSSTFYGFIAFDNCQEARKWAPSEIAFLQIAAAGISWAQQRQWDEEALRRSQSSLLLVQDQLPAILWTTNRDLKITSIRGSGRLGLNTDELGHFFSLFQLQTENTDMLEMHRRALAGQQVSFELLREERVFKARLEPFFNTTGVVVGVLGLALDITEQKQVESDLAIARDQALEASRLKSEFLATMSHEIRTPMNALLGMTELLQATALNAEQREYSDVIMNSAQDLLALINDILDLSKIEAGKLSPEVIEFELAPVVENTITLFIGRASLKRLGFMVYVAPEIPVGLKGDPVRLRQILANLVSNAIKFTEHGEVIVRVTLASVFHDRSAASRTSASGVEPTQESDASLAVRFEVQDTGIGLSEVARRRLFEPFTQADGSVSRKYGGTGLGLAISKRLVELLGGAIGVDSVEGLGATFWFTIPFLKTSGQPTAAPAVEAANLAGVHVLIADGSPAQREILRRYCTYWGMRCSEASTFSETLSRAQSARQIDDPFQLAILDTSIFTADDEGIALAQEKLSAFNLHNLVCISPYDQRRPRSSSAGPGKILDLPRPVKRAQLYEKCVEALSGSIFTSQTPVLEDALQGFSEPAAWAGGARLSQKLVLVVEDNPANQKLVTAQLKNLGYRLELCADGKQAVQAVLHHPEQIAVVLMDTQMPEMDGLEATRIIRQAETFSLVNVPIIGLTASTLQEDLDACIAAGMNAALTKPVNLEQLKSAVERWRLPEQISQANESPFASLEPAPPLDKTILDEIRSLQGEDAPNLLAELIEAYFANSRQLIERIQHSLASQDLPGLKKAVHSLKGSSGNLGALKLSELCSEIQGYVERGDVDAIRAGMPGMLAEYERVIVALAEERKACA